jgi:hypothetical protein
MRCVLRVLCHCGASHQVARSASVVGCVLFLASLVEVDRNDMSDVFNHADFECLTLTCQVEDVLVRNDRGYLYVSKNQFTAFTPSEPALSRI